MNEYHFPIVCGLGDNGGLAFMYEFMHVFMNVCISLYMYQWRTQEISTGGAYPTIL